MPDKPGKLLPFPIPGSPSGVHTGSSTIPVSKFLSHCEKHGPGMKTFMVCLCVAHNLMRPASITHPTRERAGEIICGRERTGGDKHRVSEFVPVCVKCAVSAGWV